MYTFIVNPNARSGLGQKVWKKLETILKEKKVDYKEVGGAVLLGIYKPVVKAHGSSDQRAFFGAIRQAVTFANSSIIEDIEKSVAND